MSTIPNSPPGTSTQLSFNIAADNPLELESLEGNGSSIAGGIVFGDEPVIMVLRASQPTRITIRLSRAQVPAPANPTPEATITLR